MIPLAVNVRAIGAGAAIGQTKTLGDNIGRVEKNTKASAAGMLKLWGALLLVGSTSAIASSYVGELGALFGTLVDEMLAPLMPIFDAILDALWAFADWFAQQGPVVKAIIIAIGAVIVFAFSPAIAIILAIIAVLLLLKAAWDSNFLGIRDITQAVIGKVVEWLKTAWDWIGRVIDGIKAAWDWLKSVGQATVNFVSGNQPASTPQATQPVAASSNTSTSTTYMPVNVYGSNDPQGTASAFQNEAALRRLTG